MLEIPQISSHEFARQLLAGPDLPIVIPQVEEYKTDEQYVFEPPVVTEAKAWFGDDKPLFDILVISYNAS
jgi:hypothetical protein